MGDTSLAHPCGAAMRRLPTAGGHSDPANGPARLIVSATLTIQGFACRTLRGGSSSLIRQGIRLVDGG